MRLRDDRSRLFSLSAIAFLVLTISGIYYISGDLTVSARVGDLSARSEKARNAARADMLAFALNLRSASDYTVFGQKGVRGAGTKSLEGKWGTGSDEASLGENGSGIKARSDLSKSFSAINQLPCQEFGSQITGGSFKSGVYCAPSADLAQQLILDGGGDEHGLFIFRSAQLKVSESFQLTLENGAKASNVFFVADGNASIADMARFAGNVIARGTVDIGKGATVAGRVLSLDGEVALGESASLVLQTGVIEICKAAAGGGLENRIFQFRVGGTIYEAPVGSCTPPITVPVGPMIIEELIDGRYTNQSGTWSGRFRLVSITSNVPSALSGVNLPLRSVNVNVQEGGLENVTIVTFTNTFAITGVIEICKRSVAGDPDVSGFFDYTVDAIANTVFTVPVGMCSGPILALVPTDPAAPPAPATLRVTELGEAGFNLEAASTFPANRFIALNLGQGIVNNIACSTIGNGPVPPGCVFSNPGGGFVTAQILEGGVPNQTVVNFFNRTAPGVIKICKIAGPGIPEGTRFEFLVQGTVAGPTQPFAPGTVQTRTVIVSAGPAAQGGFCRLVSDEDGANTRFIVGTNVYIDEIGAIDPVPGVPPGEIRVSRIRLNQGLIGFVTAPATVPGNAAVTPVIPARTVNPNPNLLTGEAVVRVRRGETVVEYTNFVFQPTLLKICKVAGTGVAEGTPFTFSISIDTIGGLLPGQTNQPISVPDLTVLAGPSSRGGYCAFAQGPFTPTATTPPVGTFPVGSVVTVTEAAVGGTSVTLISSPTGVPTIDLTNRTANLTLGFAGGFNELVFVNSVAAPVSTGYSLSGRVMTPDGGGLRNATVILTKADGTRMTVPTSSMGYYNFEGLANETYTVSVSSRRYRFSARSVDLSASLGNVDFTGIE